MIVEFLINVGTNDASQFGLNHQQCVKGSRAEVSERVGAELRKRGLAKKIEVAGVAPPPAIAAAKEPEIKQESKPQPEAKAARAKPAEKQSSHPTDKE